jgi:hypothetical protein
MNWYYLEKEFYDYADDIEGVNIHYVWTPRDGVADWENQRETRFMPLVQSSSSLPATGVISASPARLRKKILKLPQHILDPQSGTLTSRYLLHHYFEIFQDGRRHYSPLYTEEIVTNTNAQAVVPDTVSNSHSTPFLPAAYVEVKG